MSWVVLVKSTHRMAVCFIAVVCLATLGTVGAACPHTAPGLKRWSHDLTWPNQMKPGHNARVSIREGVLLDETPPELHSITIEPTGRLVWSPEGDFNLTLKYIKIQGRLDIGSEDCKFEKKSHITLTGIRGQYKIRQGYHTFNEKFVGVAPGGTLELHGQKKLSWTKLTRTVPKLSTQNGLIYNHKTSSRKDTDRWKTGIMAYVFDDKTGAVINFGTFYLAGPSKYYVQNDPPKLVSFLDSAPPGKIVLLSVQSNMVDPAVDLSAIYDAVENITQGNVTGRGLLRRVQKGDAYVMVTQKGNPSTTSEKVGTNFNLIYQEAATSLTLWNNKIKFSVSSFIHNIHSSWSSANFRVITTDRAYPVLRVLDDVTTWKAGDQILLTSTDYNWQQAEIGHVIECVHCTAKQIRVDLEVAYEHWGEIIDGVDQRGEVALLSRNIVIEGRMENTCPPSNGNCHKFKYDTFGGHLKIVRGFKDAHIEGVEFYHMGQQTEKGHYPIHFHLARDVDRVGNYSYPPYVKDNSIHHTLCRCVTVHGTHGVLVQDNVGFDSLGHCYFLEDGGEKRNVFDGNLGAGTRKGTVIPSDSRPATFWMTNPKNQLRNNVAAGSDGTGIWYVFPDEPLGPSKGLGFMQKDEARHTAIAEFNNNVAHSNFQDGLLIENKIRTDETVGDDNYYDPRVNPLDPNSPAQQVLLYRLTAYKNRQRNAWVRGGWFLMDRASIADSARGLTFARLGQQQQFLSNSIITGESRNLGEPTQFYDGHGHIPMPRSRPIEYDYKRPIQGFIFYDGPVYIKNVWFSGFKTNENYTSGALSFKERNGFSSSPVSSVTNIKFKFNDDQLTGNRVYDGNETVHGFTNYDGDKGATFRDIDGSVTGFPGSTVVKPDPFYVNARCYRRDNWNMAICPQKYGKILLLLRSSSDAGKTHPFMIRDDNPQVRETMSWQHPAGFPVILGSDHSYTLNWDHHVPHQFDIHGLGVEKNQSVRIGVCLPRGARFDLYSYNPIYKPHLGDWQSVSSLQELDSDNQGGKYLWDTHTGLLFFKFVNYYIRSPNETMDCPKNRCPMVRITLTAGNNMDADCSARAYGPYRRAPTPSTLGLHKVALPASTAHPPKGWGAGPTRPFITRIPIDGQFGQWSGWSTCSKTCGGGVKTRTRSCDHPMPQNGGKDCPGPRSESQACATQHCPVDGGWSNWTTWTSCTKVTGCHGYQKRRRSCSSPSPNYDGVYCERFDEEVRACKVC